ncbi:MAG: adenosine kinase [Pseudomonadota bacterium]
MTDTRYDVLAIGNAIVDVMASAEDDFLARHAMTKGSMMLIDADQARNIYADMGKAQEISGGSAANTLAGLAELGARCAFIGQVANDQLGEIFAHDIRAAGVDFTTAAREGEPPTARCLILVTPDGQRTMNTFLGASQFLPASALDEELIASAGILYLEGYLWDPEEPRNAMLHAIDLARAAGRKVAFTMSDAFVIDRYRDDFQQLLDEGRIDILFANEVEIKSLTRIDDFDAAVAKVAPQVPTLAVTRGPDGAVAMHQGEYASVRAQPIEKVVDTTGAGDLFAAGFLKGIVDGRPVSQCLTMGAIAAAEIISHFGARSEARLSELVAAQLPTQ